MELIYTGECIRHIAIFITSTDLSSRHKSSIQETLDITDDTGTGICCYIRKSVITKMPLYLIEIPNALTTTNENLSHQMETTNVKVIMDENSDITDEKPL